MIFRRNSRAPEFRHAEGNCGKKHAKIDDLNVFAGIRASKLRTLVTMIGRMKMNTFTFRESFDRAPYRKSACVFESRFLTHARAGALPGAGRGGALGEEGLASRARTPVAGEVPARASAFGRSISVQKAALAFLYSLVLLL